MRNLFDDQLNTLHRKLIEMGSACETAIDLAVKALLEGNTEIAHEAAAHDREIDQMERDIESICRTPWRSSDTEHKEKPGTQSRR